MSDKSLKSTGTIRVQFGATRNGAKKMLFIPSTDLTVRRDGKQHAVFIPVKKKGRLRSTPLPKSGEGVSIKVKGNLPGLVEAATRQTLVEVEVKKRGSGWTLRTITVPAPDKPK